MKRLLSWLWRKIAGPGPRADQWRPPEYDSTGVKIGGLPWDHPLSDPLQDVKDYIKRDREGNAFVGQAKDAIEAAEADATQAIFDDPELNAIGKKVIEYPPPVEQTTQEWVTEQLQKRTGGITRHPFDKTQYPTPPTEADLAARDYVNNQLGGGPSVRAYFTHGYSMRRLSELQRMAERREYLTTEELQALRARGLA